MATYEKQTVSDDNRPDQVDVDGQTYLRVAETVLAKALSPLKAREIVERSLNIAADICIYTNRNLTIEEL